MKNSILLCLLATPVLALASAPVVYDASKNTMPNNATKDDGMYAQLDVGYGLLSGEEADYKYKDNTAPVRFAIGGYKGNLRAQMDYTHFGELTDVETKHNLLSDSQYGIGVKAQSLGVSALYDFKNKSTVTPYVGVRANLSQLKATVTNANHSILGTQAVVYDEKDVHAGFGAMAGVQVSITPNIALDAGLEINHLGRVGEDSDTAREAGVGEADIWWHGAKIGVRTNF